MDRLVAFLLIFFFSWGGVWTQIGQDSPQTLGSAKNESIRARLKQARSLLDNAPANALKILQSLLTEVESSDDRVLLMEVLSHTGGAYSRLSDYQPSLEHYQRSLQLARDLQNRRFEASTLRNISVIHRNRGEYGKSLNFSRQILTIYRELDDRRGIARTWFHLGSVYDSMGQYRRALEYYHKARVVFQELKDPILYRVLNDIGITNKNLGNYQQALDDYAHALGEQRRVNDKLGQAITLSNIGVAYKELGQDERAIAYYQQSLTLARELGEQRGQSILLGNLGEAYIALGDYRRAIEYYQQSLQLARNIGDRNNEAIALHGIGDIHLRLGNLRQARTSYKQALKIRRTIGAKKYEGITLVALAVLSLRQGEPRQALTLSQQALKLGKQTGNPEVQWEARLALARALRVGERTEEAVDHLRASIETINSVRARVHTDRSKIGYLDRRQAVFHELVDLLSQQGQLGEALEIAEAARNRALIDLLAQRQVTVKPADAERLAEIRETEARLRAQARVNLSHEGAGAELAQRRAVGENELKHRLRWLQDERGELASLIVAEPLTFQQITGVAQRLEATLVEYLVTEKHLFIWVINPSGEVKSATVGIERERLRQIVRDLHQRLDDFDLAALADPRPVRARLRELYRTMLAPVAAHLPRDPQALVYLIPHDVLFLVPFAALVDEDGRYLIEKHTLVSAPSISVLQYTGEKHRFVVSPDEPHLLAVGDPQPPGNADLGALPGARAEVQKISRFFPSDQVTQLLGREASEANLKRLSPGQTNLHLAVHGLIYDDRPWESALILSQGEGEDGWLKVSEIFGLDLHADLIVLSGCSTGLGKLSGDGIIGLSRAFVYAGTPSLLVSRWDVSDKATTDLMERFYQEMSQGHSKAQALRAAKLAGLRRFRHPALWAAFELVGEAR